MEYRYMGFDQNQNMRVYRFDGLNKGEPAVHLVISADLTLFRTHRIGIQDGPGLCAHKLSAGLEAQADANFELTNEDFQAHAYARAEAEARRAGSRKNAPRRRPPV